MAEDLSINKNKIFARRYGNSNNDICRLCLKNEAHMEPLFYANLFPNILLTKKIYDCTSIQILYERNLPMFICKLCANKLDEYGRFRERCIANDEFLRNALAAFDMAGSSVPMIKMEPEDTPPPPAKLAQCLGVLPMELNCALVAAATAAAATHGHQAPATGHKQEPPDEEPMDRSEFDCGGDPLEDGCRTRLSGDEDGEDTLEDDAEGEEEDDGGRYVCEVCPKSFKIRHHLLVHSHTHLNHQPSVPPSGGGGGGVGISGTDGGKQASYACPKCAKVFVNRGNLLNHLETHTNEKSYACDICSKSFKYNVQLRLHMRIHTGERPHKCEICNRGFSQLSNLRSHRKTHSKVKPYKCHLCLKSFTVADNLTAHSAKCLKDKFRCTLCSKSFAKEGNLLSHLQSHSEGIVEKTFKCEMCPKSFKNKEDWKRHVRVHTGEKPYTCDICSKGFAQKANLLSHRKTHLKPTVVFKCDRCDRTFRSQKVLEVHRPKCTGESAPSESTQDSPSPLLATTPPETAGAATTTAMTDSTPTLSEALSDLLRYEIALRAPLELQQMLLGHMDRKSVGGGGATTVGGHHGKATSGRRYRCDVCFKGYSQYPSLIKHRKLHFKVPPLVKVLASKAAAAAAVATAKDATAGDTGQEPPVSRSVGTESGHTVATVSAERPYSCDICGKTFKYNRNLKVHAKLHIRANRFKCDKCPNTFAQAEALRHHLRTHPIAAERTFSCEFCSNLFRSKEDLNRHRRSHTGERPFPCQRCPKAFTQLSNLRAHTRIHERPTNSRSTGPGPDRHPPAPLWPPLPPTRQSTVEDSTVDTAGGGAAEVPEDDGGGGEGSRAAATNNNIELPDEEGDHHPNHHHHHHYHHRRRPSKTVYSLNMNVCRLCLCEGHDNLQPVFYGKDELDAVLQQKIHELTTVEITYATDFPTAVCVDCLTKLEEWAIYRRQCIDNNEMLRAKYLELKSELDCYREPHTTGDPGDHQHYQQQQELRRSPAVKEEQEVLRLMDEDEGDADGQMNGRMTCEEATAATSYGHELDADGNEIIIGADGATTKIQYVNEDGTMTEYVTAAPGAVIRRSGSAAGLDDQQQQQQQEELRIDGDPYADGPQDDERHEIYYTVGTDGAYAIHANAAGYVGAQTGSYVPQGFDNQTEIECTTIQEHLPEEYVEEGVISPAGLSAAGAAAGPAMIATSTRGAHDRPFVCKHCKTSFKYEHNYDRHMKNHAKVLYRCGKCSKTFVKLRKCQQHFMKAHSSQRYECDICFRTYSLPTRLENHVIEMHSKNGVYSCDRCRGEQFASYLDFKAHRMTQHPRNNDNTGSTGGGSVGSEATIPAIIKQTAYGDVVHMQQILTPLGTPFEDPDGDAGSPSSDGAEMEAHDGRNNRRGSNSKPSPVGKSRSGPTGVTRTRRPNGRLVGAGGKKSSPRKQVSLVPVIPSQQQEVILIDDDEQQQQHNNGMELNGAGSSGLDASGNALHRQLLRQIEESEANSLGPKLYPCESCSQTFAHLNNLKAHIYAEHDNDKPFKCKLCPISFKTKEILVMHMLLHSQHSSTI